MFAFLSRKPDPTVLERLAEVESFQKVLELQMDELKALYRRAIARNKWDNSEGAERTEGEPSSATADSPAAAGPHALLTPKQRQIQQQILQRRIGG